MSDDTKEVKVEDWAPTALREHPKLKSALQVLDTHPKFQIDESVCDEINMLISVSKEKQKSAENMRLPKRYKTVEDLHLLGGFIAEAQACRDRAIEIKIGHMPHRRALMLLWEKCVGFLYKFEEIRKCAPAPARDAAINYVLAPLRERIEMVNNIIEAAGEADRNLGNTYFTLKELKSIGIAYIEAQNIEKGH